MNRQWGWSFGGGDADGVAAQGGSRAEPSARPPGSAPPAPAAPPVAARAVAPAAQPPVCNGVRGGAAGVRGGTSKTPPGGALESAQLGAAKPATVAAAAVSGAQRPKAQPVAAAVVVDAPEADAEGAEAVSPGGASQTSDFDEDGGDLDELVANAQSVMAAAEAATARLLEQRDMLQPTGEARRAHADDDSE